MSFPGFVAHMWWGGGGALMSTWPKSGPIVMNSSTNFLQSKIWMQESIYFVFKIANWFFYVNHLVQFGPPKYSCIIYLRHNVDNYMFNYDHTQGKTNKAKLFRLSPLVYQKMVTTKIYIYISVIEEQPFQLVYFLPIPNLFWSWFEEINLDTELWLCVYTKRSTIFSKSFYSVTQHPWYILLFI